MLGLKLKTDPRWARIAEDNLEEILSDHAWCEQKATTNAISLITLNSEKTDMVDALVEVAFEELTHFKQVREIIKERGLYFGRERKDDYVNQLYKFCQKGGARDVAMVDRLLFSAMIEARSCERFRVLSENLKDEKLSNFYRELMISEANHYTLFLGFAKKYGGEVDVEKRWNEWLEFEGDLIQSYGNKESIHG
jgi:tRNA 2-(methylsulfanyl)-N6-isopentenyladenosine37 hydroxylase